MSERIININAPIITGSELGGIKLGAGFTDIFPNNDHFSNEIIEEYIKFSRVYYNIDNIVTIEYDIGKCAVVGLIAGVGYKGKLLGKIFPGMSIEALEKELPDLKQHRIIDEILISDSLDGILFYYNFDRILTAIEIYSVNRTVPHPYKKNRE